MFVFIVLAIEGYWGSEKESGVLYDLYSGRVESHGGSGAKGLGTGGPRGVR